VTPGAQDKSIDLPQLRVPRTRGKLRCQQRREPPNHSVRIGTRAAQDSVARNRRQLNTRRRGHSHLNTRRLRRLHEEFILAIGHGTTRLTYPRNGSGGTGSGKRAGDGMAPGVGSQPGNSVALETGGRSIAPGYNAVVMVASTSHGLASACPSAQDIFFRIGTQPIIVDGYPHFNYGGFSFMMVDPWPEDWSSDWYADDDVYIDYDDGYYLYNRRHPGVGIAVSVVM
jgi:hypothetical protein